MRPVIPPERHALEIAARLITARTDPEHVIDAVLAACIEVTRANRALLALVDRRNGELVISSVAGEGWTEAKKRERLRAGSGVHQGIIGLVATTEEPYMAGDVDTDPYYWPLFDDVGSELAVPFFRSGDRIRGVLNIESGEKHAFTDDDMRLVTGLAALASVAVSRSEHHRRERRLAETAQMLNQWGDIDDQLGALTHAAADILRAYDASLFLVEPDRRSLVLVASEGPLREQTGQAMYAIGEGLTGTVAEHGHAVRLENVADDPHWVGKHQEIPQERIAGFLAVPILGEDGVIEGVLRVIRDKTPDSLPNAFDRDDENILTTVASQVAVLLRRRTLLKRLMQSERLGAWGQLSARAAHIIGNKVFAIKGSLSELRYLFDESPSCSPDCWELIEAMGRSLSEIDGIVQSFKDFVASRDLKRVPIDINLLVAGHAERAGAAAEHIQFSVDLAPELPLVRGDSSRVGECFDEIIQNAVSWQPNGGAVRIRTSCVGAAEAATVADVGRAERYVRVDVEDDGPGISPEMKSKVFTPFFSSRGRGLGLGLPICQEVIRAHGGEIVEVGDPPGAHFVVLLPVTEPREGVL